MNPNDRFDQWHDQIPYYVAGTLPARERLALIEHLKGCATCRAEVEAWKTIAEAVRAESTARVAIHEMPVLDLSKLPATERKLTMSQNPTIVGQVAKPALRSMNRIGWLGSGASLVTVFLIMALAVGILLPMFGVPFSGLLGNAAQTSTPPQSLSTLPGDCPPSPLAMPVNSDTGVAVGGYPLWAVMGSYSASLAFYGEARSTPNGWAQKVLWLVQTNYQGAIIVHGANLKTNAPIRFDPFPTNIGPTTTTLTIDDRVLNVSPAYQRWVTLPGTIYVPEAGCYSLEMDWAGGSWRITFPAGLVSAQMETATASAMPISTGTSVSGSMTLVTSAASNCNVSLDTLLKQTETALPSVPAAGSPEVTPQPQTFAPIPLDQLQSGCGLPLNLSVSPIPICPTVESGLSPTASPTGILPDGLAISCLQPGKSLYMQVCPPTIPLGNTYWYRTVIGPPFPSCFETTSQLPNVTLSPEIRGTPTPMASNPVTNCASQVGISTLLELTETALPSVLPLTPGQTARPLPTFAPMLFDQIQMPGCPSPTPNLTASSIPICTTPTDGLQPTASPTAAMPGAVEVDCLPPGKAVYIQVCPPTIPIASSLSFHAILGPPFPSCDSTPQLSTIIPTPTAIGTPTLRPSQNTATPAPQSP